MEEGRLAYRVRTAEAGDESALRAAIGTTLAHPDHQGRRQSYRGAAARGDILVLERYDRPSHDWHVAGFVECHMRVDDNLSIRDIGTTGDEPQTGVVRYLLDQAFNSFRPVGAQVKIRRDARTWLEIFEAIAGFQLDGEEYRRPHYWTIWLWDRERARAAERAGQRPPRQEQQRPRPPQPPAASERPARGAGGPAGPQRSGGPQRPGGSGGPQRSGGPAGPARPGGPGRPPVRNAQPPRNPRKPR